MKETAKTYTFTLIEEPWFDNLGKSKLTLYKTGSPRGNPFEEWSGKRFLVYPDQRGIPYFFEPIIARRKANRQGILVSCRRNCSAEHRKAARLSVAKYTRRGLAAMVKQRITQTRQIRRKEMRPKRLTCYKCKRKFLGDPAQGNLCSECRRPRN